MAHDTVRRNGKRPVSIGDLVRISGHNITVGGVTFKDRGWTATLVDIEDGGKIAVVEMSRCGRYGKAGIRRVAMGRVTRRYR